MEIERGNILAVTRFAIQELLDYISLHQLSVVDYDEQNQDSSILSGLVLRLLCIIEKGLCHGIAPSTKFLNPIPLDPWPIICSLPFENTMSIENASMFDDIKTGLGRVRLWIRISLMSKQLGSFIKRIVDIKSQKNINISLTDIYAEDALLMSDDGAIFASLLSDLSVVDFCFVLKNNLDLLDGPVSCPQTWKVCCFSQLVPIDYRPRISSDFDEKAYQKYSSQSHLCKLNKDVASLTSENSSLQAADADLNAKILILEDKNRRLSNLLVRQSKESQNELQAPLETSKCSTLTLEMQNVELLQLLNKEKERRLIVEETNVQQKKVRDCLEAVVRALSREKDGSQALVALSRKFSQEMQSVVSELQTSKKHAGDLEEKVTDLSTTLATVNESYNQLKVEKVALEKSLQDAIARSDQADQICAQLNTYLEENQEITRNLQSQLDEAYIDLASVQALQDNLDRKSQSLRERDAMIVELQRKCEDAEKSLVEMAGVVEAARLKADRAEERVHLLTTARWTNDCDANNCALCAATFSFSLRKHHCRNCGLIFCHDCSAFNMSLPSSCKPVRVCETCHNQLMQRYSTR